MKKFYCFTILSCLIVSMQIWADESEWVPPKLSSRLTADQKAEQLAQSALALGRLADTESAMREMVKNHASSSAAHYWLGKVLQRKDETREATNEFHLSIQNDPLNLDARLDYALALADNNKLSAAIDQLEFLLRIDSNQIIARAKLASLYLRNDQLDRAIQEYETVAAPSSQHPIVVEARSRLDLLYTRKVILLSAQLNSDKQRAKALQTAIGWIKQNRLDPAQWLLNSLIEADPYQTEANYWLGYIYLQRSQLSVALPYLKKAVTDNPEDVKYLESYAQTLARLGKLEDSKLALRQITEQTEDEEILRSTRQRINMVEGEILMRAGEPERALEHYRKLLTSETNNVALLSRISNIYITLGRQSEAEQVAQRAAQVQKLENDKARLISEAQALLAEGRLASAGQKLTQILSKDPTHSQAYYWMASIYATQNRFDEAILQMQKSIAFAPENQALQKEYARLLVKGSHLNEARRVYMRLAQNTEDIEERRTLIRLAQYIKGQLLLEEKDYAATLSHYQTMALQFPDDLSIMDALASLYIQLNMLDDAQEIYLAAIEHDSTRAMTYLRLAGLSAKMQDDKQRRFYFTETLKKDPGGNTGKTALDNLLAVAQQAQRNQAYAYALEEYQAILSVFPNNIVSLAGASFCAQQLSQDDLAMRLYQRLLDNTPDNVKVRIDYAHLLIRNNKLEAAIEEFETVMSIEPKSMSGLEANANLDILYNSRADAAIAQLEMQPQDAVLLNQTVEKMRIWIQEKGRVRAAKRVLREILKHDNNNEKAHYWLGSIYDREQQFDNAIYHTATSIALAPANPQLQVAFGRVLARSGNLDAAEAIYRNVISESHGTVVGRETTQLLAFIEGQQLIQKGLLTQALAHYKRMLDDTPNDNAIRARIANVYLNMNEFDNAESQLLAILEEQDNSPAIHMQLAQLYEKKGDKAAHTQQLRRVLALDPKGALGQQALNKLGLSEGIKNLLAKQWDKAVDAFEKIILIEPDNISANLGMATAYLESGAYDNAQLLLTKVLQLDPSNLEARLKMARLLVAIKRTSEAMLELERIVAASKETDIGREALVNLTNIYRERGATYLQQGYADAAVREYRKAINKNPDDWRAHYELGRIFQSAIPTAAASQRTNLYEMATKHYDEVIRLNPLHYQTHLNSASIYETTEQYTKAQQAFAYALSTLEESNQTLYNMLGNAARIQGVRQEFAENNLDWVIDELEDMISIEPDNVRLHLFLSTVFIRKNEPESAIAELKIAVDLMPQNITARYRLGQLYEQNSDLELAADQYRNILLAQQQGLIIEAARERLLFIEDRLSLLSIRLQYSSSLSRSRSEGITGIPGQPQLAANVNSSNFSSTLRIQIQANVRPSKFTNVTLNLSPIYSTFHTAGNDSLTPLIELTGNYSHKNGYASASLNHSETKGLLLEDARGEEDNINLTFGRRLRIPLFFSDIGSNSPSTLQLQGIYRDYRSDNASFYQFKTVSTIGSFIYPLQVGGSVSLSYSLADTSTNNALSSDYDNFSQTFAARISRPLATRLYGSMNASVNYEMYKNVDRNYLESGRKRRTGQVNFGMGLQYQLHRRLNLFMDISIITHKTNMARGIITIPDSNRLGFQASSLGDFTNVGVNAGMQFQF